MWKIVKADNGMNIVGQDIWVMLATLPAAVAAVAAHLHGAAWIRIPLPEGVLVPLGAALLLPGLSLLTGTWAYLGVAAVLCLAVSVFIRREERVLLAVFGDEYRRYTARVHRMVPLLKP